MQEETEIAKVECQTVNEIADIYENPVVKCLLGAIKVDLGGIGSGIETKLRERQKYKEKVFLEAVCADGTVTMKDVEDVDFIIEFAMTYNAVMKLLQNEKTIFFANLLKNTALSSQRNTNIFQEALERLCSLSYREIEMLFLLKQCQERYEIEHYNIAEESIQRVRNIWKDFINKAEKKLELSEEMIESIFCGIERTGFCRVVNVLYPGATSKCYCVSCYFDEFAYYISSRDIDDIHEKI